VTNAVNGDRRRRGGVAAAVLTGALLTGTLLAGCGEATPEAASTPGHEPGRAAQDASAASRAPDNPLAGRTFYVDPNSPAAQQVSQWSGPRKADADHLRKIADRPVAHWIGGGTADGVEARVEAVVGPATAKGQLPVLVAYNIPLRDCGSFSAGGATSSAEYRAWIRAFAKGVKGRPAVVILEPDAVAHMVDGCTAATDRYALLTEAVGVLRTASTAVYIDAGNPRWITDVGQLATALQQAGVAQANGFALNVANFISTADNVAYGNRLSDALAGKHFVVDTSRNGAGPVPGDGDVNGGPRWCNPPGRTLGQPPTGDTGQPRLDALLWIKRPGESDGACRPGEPSAGQWWPDYALDLAKRS
jgi:endoglucanase